MSELIAFQGRTQRINIAERIGVEWRKVGTVLLDDKYYNIIPAIGEKHVNNAEAINMEILGCWVQGKGMPDRTWRELLSVLKMYCVSLAESVEEALTEAEQGK